MLIRTQEISHWGKKTPGFDSLNDCMTWKCDDKPHLLSFEMVLPEK